jgi:hypothetical protein
MVTGEADLIRSAVFDAWSEGCVGDAVIDYVLIATYGMNISADMVAEVVAELFNAMKD